MDETNSNPHFTTYGKLHIPRADHHEMGYMENIVYRNSNTTKPQYWHSNQRVTSSQSYCRFHDAALGI